MIGLATLSKRIERLEPVPDTLPDIVGAVLSSLSDDHISLLEEQSVLLEHGFDEEAVAGKMGKRYPKSLKAAETFRKRYQDIQEQMKPKTKPTKKHSRGLQSILSPMQI
jgi:hypothetical protein